MEAKEISETLLFNWTLTCMFVQEEFRIECTSYTCPNRTRPYHNLLSYCFFTKMLQNTRIKKSEQDLLVPCSSSKAQVCTGVTCIYGKWYIFLAYLYISLEICQMTMFNFWKCSIHILALIFKVCGDTTLKHFLATQDTKSSRGRMGWWGGVSLEWCRTLLKGGGRFYLTL
jgi:hypothetical protein